MVNTTIMSETVTKTSFESQKSSFRILFTTVFLDFLGFSIVLPYLYFYATSLGASEFTYGLLVTSYAIMQFIFAPVLGRLSDHYGRRKVIILSLIGASVSYFLFGIANALWLLFVSRIAAGAMGATYPVAQAYIADVTTEEKRMHYYGLLGAAWAVGAIIGPALGGTLSTLYGYGLPSFVASALSLVNLVAAYARLPEPQSRLNNSAGGKKFSGPSSLTMMFRSRELSMLFSVLFLVGVSCVILEVTLAPWLQKAFGFGPMQAGFIYLYVGVVTIVTQALLLPRVSNRLAPTKMAMIGVALVTGSFFAMGSTTDFAVVIIAGGFFTIGNGLLVTTVNTLISLSAGRGTHGSVMGAAQSFSSLSQVVAPSIAATVFGMGVSTGVVGLSLIAAGAISLLALPPLLLYTSKGYAGVFPEKNVVDNVHTPPSLLEADVSKAETN